MKEFVIDLFCGAGGTSTGAHLADGDITVTACVNHDRKAIESHALNHPKAKHFIEDIRNPEVVFLLKIRVNALRKLYHGCIITIWASLECTNFSKAKGGQPRDADSRTLAEHLFMYLDELQPDYLMIENVIEFMCWGPLCENGKPISKRAGTDYLRWINNVQSYGYDFEWRQLNAADFGAYTSRTRYFAQFAKYGMPIAWPEPTHTKTEGVNLKKWKPVKEVLDLNQFGNSIFNRKKPLVENTLKRIYAGLIKFVASGDESFIQSYYSGNDSHRNHSIDEPAKTVTTNNRIALVNADFLQSYYGNGNAHSVDEPCPTVSTKDRFAKINYLMMNYTSGQHVRSIDYPAGAVVGNDKHNVVSVFPWVQPMSFDNNGRSIDEPAPTVLASRKHHYLINPQFSNNGNSIDVPAPVIIARQDKKPLGLISCELGEGYSIPVYEDDCETMVKIKIFMAHFGVVDIKMRMLFVNELLKIQGFPEDYKLVGNQTDQKKFIGNSVEVTTAKKIFEAHYNALYEFKAKKYA
jgi:DNA (cytosine-5)-methyltransferase 1